MRKFCLSVLMPLLMLLSQQGMAWHEIGHLTNPPAGQGDGSQEQEQEQKQKQKPANDKLCEVCYAFAHLGSGAATAEFAAPLITLKHVLAASELVASHAGPAPSERSRGPPTLL